MYQKAQLLAELKSLLEDVQDWIDILESDQFNNDTKRFYKKGLVTPGRRVRQTLKVIRDLSQQWRMDILRLKKEREIFKDTELEGDFKHVGHKPTPK